MKRIIDNHFMDIYIANVNYPYDVKARPALVLENVNDKFRVLKITTKFPKQKPSNIGKNYFIIRYWKEAGLSKPSCVDTNNWYDITKSDLTKNPLIGKLTLTDSSRLFRFIIKQHGLHL